MQIVSYNKKLQKSLDLSIKDYKNYFDKTITTTLYVESINSIKTKNLKRMSFVKLSDEYSTVEGIIFPDVYSKLGEIKKNNVYKIQAKVERRNSTYQLIIYNMILLSN